MKYRDILSGKNDDAAPKPSDADREIAHNLILQLQDTVICHKYNVKLIAAALAKARAEGAKEATERAAKALQEAAQGHDDLAKLACLKGHQKDERHHLDAAHYLREGIAAIRERT